MDREYHEGEQVSRHQCMLQGTRAGYINKYESKGKTTWYVDYMALFIKKYVVWEKDNLVKKQAAIDKWKKLVGWDGSSTYVDRLKQ